MYPYLVSNSVDSVEDVLFLVVLVEDELRPDGGAVLNDGESGTLTTNIV